MNSLTGGATRSKAIHERETKEALAKKKPNNSVPINLCSSDEED